MNIQTATPASSMPSLKEVAAAVEAERARHDAGLKAIMQNQSPKSASALEEEVKVMLASTGSTNPLAPPSALPERQPPPFKQALQAYLQSLPSSVSQEITEMNRDLQTRKPSGT